ncbi:MAG: hypothetical protein M5R42_17990 [Rhodocyclaceae bacterium]|jgi:hypothetical protein|nr:hypothetical protein [Rhodocyclaceae bacterium]
MITIMTTTITTTPITADLSGSVPPGGTKTEKRETDKALRGILKQLGVSA